MARYGCLTPMRVVRLLAPTLEHEDHAKDLDFSPDGIRHRRDTGYRHRASTFSEFPQLDGSRQASSLIGNRK
jgi:NTE family protein